MLDYFLAETLKDQRAQEAQHQADLYRLAGGARRADPGWVSRQYSWLLGQLGSELVALGQRLERHAPARPVFREGT